MSKVEDQVRRINKNIQQSIQPNSKPTHVHIPNNSNVPINKRVFSANRVASVNTSSVVGIKEGITSNVNGPANAWNHGN